MVVPLPEWEITRSGYLKKTSACNVKRIIIESMDDTDWTLLRVVEHYQSLPYDQVAEIIEMACEGFWPTRGAVNRALKQLIKEENNERTCIESATSRIVDPAKNAD